MPKARMKQEYKQEWLYALRSGACPQTTGVLRRNEPGNENGVLVPAGYCCLGVLCEILVSYGVLESKDSRDIQEYSPVGEVDPLDREAFTLPPIAMDAVDLQDSDGDRGRLASDEVRVSADDLPTSLQRVVLRYLHPSHPDIFSAFTLAELNDAGAPFSVIAEVIEHGIEGI